MDATDLKIFALEYIKLHDNLLKEEKLALGEFVIEASDEQVKFMLFTGEVKDKLNKEELSYIKEIGITEPGFGHVIINLTKGEFAIGATVAAAAIMWYAMKGMMKLAQAKQCRNMKSGSTEGRICENEVIIRSEKKRIEILRAKMHLCKNSKDKTKCESKVKEKIVKSETKIKEKQIRIKDLKQKLKVKN